MAYVAVEGLIGAGKSTLASAMCMAGQGKFMREPIEENPFLSRMYAGEPGTALPMQLTFLLHRFAQQLEIAELRTKDLVVTDYAWEKEPLFASVLLTAEDERALHANLFRAFSSRIERPDVLIYLDVSPETCLRRIAVRGRRMERNIDEPYLLSLQERYQSWLSTYSGRLVRIAPPEARNESGGILDFALRVLAAIQ